MTNDTGSGGPPRLLIVSAAALIDAAGRVLVQRRPAGKPMAGLWEFPGGKLELGESPQAALVRELAEELAITVDPDRLEPVTFSTGLAGQRPLLLLLFACRQWAGEPQPLHATALQWLRPSDLATIAMPPADGPLVDALISRAV